MPGESKNDTAIPSRLSAAFERHYSPEQLAEPWQVSSDTVRRLFEHEPGVIVIERSDRKRGRRYRTLRIPEWVALRVYRRLGNPVHEAKK